MNVVYSEKQSKKELRELVLKLRVWRLQKHFRGSFRLIRGTSDLNLILCGGAFKSFTSATDVKQAELLFRVIAADCWGLTRTHASLHLKARIRAEQLVGPAHLTVPPSGRAAATRY